MTPDTTLITIVVNGVLTPIFVLLTLWVRSTISSKQRSLNREDGFIAGLEKRVLQLETEVREVRIELKNRDEEYLDLYKKYTTLLAKYEVLLADHEDMKKKYGKTATGLDDLKADIKNKAEEAALVIKSIQ